MGCVAYLLDRQGSGTRKDRGWHWWDTRSEEFYSLPFDLNKFFSSV
ncbi:hypothetical protein ZOSMA_16G00630 [Zostera marina]|uniref:Uncharacterized protein n=1 Tax=Zostera marina TaxID=29655 RepID=A0A0K9PSV1_ZOSMR|nr:hypothetical protein ZOSMA_16G00630 [Zostera marina]